MFLTTHRSYIAPNQHSAPSQPRILLLTSLISAIYLAKQNDSLADRLLAEFAEISHTYQNTYTNKNNQFNKGESNEKRSRPQQHIAGV